jgi:hypothetical protein
MFFSDESGTPRRAVIQQTRSVFRKLGMNRDGRNLHLGASRKVRDFDCCAARQLFGLWIDRDLP